MHKTVNFQSKWNETQQLLPVSFNPLVRAVPVRPEVSENDQSKFVEESFMISYIIQLMSQTHEHSTDHFC